MANAHVNRINPVWDSAGNGPDVQSLFKTPYFDEGQGEFWYGQMATTPHKIFLFDKPNQPNNVFQNGHAIYTALASGWMPDGGPFWPDDAVEMFQVWYNLGGPVKTSDPSPVPNQPKVKIATYDKSKKAKEFVMPPQPVWDAQGKQDHDIKECFTQPCWIDSGANYADMWRSAMMNFQYDASKNEMFDIQNYDHIKGWASNVYNQLASGAMPVTPMQKAKEWRFPPAAVEAFKVWCERGCPKTTSDPVQGSLLTTPISSISVKKPVVARKSIVDLSPQELLDYRRAIIRLNPYSPTSSTWQTGGQLHAHWCLHYMQASFPWHRAHLMWLEAQLGVPIPYWNFFSSEATNKSSNDYGIPQAFLDDTFTDPSSGTQPNPLRHALAREGKSRASTGATVTKEVQRAPELTNLAERDTYISTFVPRYRDEILKATQITTLSFTNRQDNTGFTFATPDLKTSNDALFYPQVNLDFDVALEQAHDNYHGWCGPDMANNSYAAYDPLFWSYHANYDRLFEHWIAKNGTAQKWTTTAPLRPFVITGTGKDVGVSVVENDMGAPYTTIGAMVSKSSDQLGYTYQEPKIPDYTGAAPAPAPAPLPEGPEALSEAPAEVSQAPSQLSRQPHVVFPDTKCTNNTYYIHVGLDKEPDKKLVIGEPGYIGHLTRLGMGPDNGNNRCIQRGIIRKLDGAVAAREIGLQSTDPLYLKVLVKKDIPDGDNVEVSESEYKDWEGFSPILLW